MALHVLFNELYKQCQTNNSLSDTLCWRLEQMHEDVRHLLVSRTRNDMPPLAVAAKQGALHIVEYLLDKCKADVDQPCMYTPDDGQKIKMTPLMMATSLPIVRHLVEHGADININLDDQWTPLLMHCQGSSYEIVEYLIKQGADVNQTVVDGDTYLHCVVDDPKITKMLIKGGANVNGHNRAGYTPLHVAVRSDNTSYVKLLFKNGADPMVKDLCNGLDVIQSAFMDGNICLAEYLINNGTYGPTIRADYHKLLGASYVMLKKGDKAIKLWRKSLDILREAPDRHRSPVSKGLIVNSGPRPLFKDRNEFETYKDLNELICYCEAIQVQSYIICYRCLGSSNFITIKTMKNIVNMYAKQFQFQKCLEPLKYYFVAIFGTWDEIDLCPEVQKKCVAYTIYMLLDAVEHFGSDVLVDQYPAVATILMHLESHLKEKPQKTNYNYHFFVALIDLMRKIPFRPCKREYETLIRLMFKNGIIRNDRGNSLLHFAVFKGGPETNRDRYFGKGFTFKYPRAEIVQFLLDNGHPVDFLNAKGESPLHCVLYTEYDADVVKCLLDNGAHIDRVDAKGISPCHLLNSVPGFNTFQYMSLKCLAAQAIVRHRVPYKVEEFPAMANFISMH